MKHHPAGRRQTINKQAAAVILKSLRDTRGCGRGGASPSQCVSAHVCVCACALRRGKRALRAAVPALPGGCLLTAPFASHHSRRVDVRSDRSDLHATSASPDAHTHTQTCARSRQSERWAMYETTVLIQAETRWDDDNLTNT